MISVHLPHSSREKVACKHFSQMLSGRQKLFWRGEMHGNSLQFYRIIAEKIHVWDQNNLSHNVTEYILMSFYQYTVTMGRTVPLLITHTPCLNQGHLGWWARKKEEPQLSFKFWDWIRLKFYIFTVIPEISGIRSASKLVLNYKYCNIKISKR